MPQSLHILMSSGSGGNFTNANSWRLADAASFLDSEAANTVSTTTFVSSSTFAPGAITVDGIAIKVANFSNTQGTMSVQLWCPISQSSVFTSSISTLDIGQSLPSTGYNRGWYFLKAPTPVALSASTNYAVGMKTNGASVNVYVYSSATTNWSRMLRTTQSAAPTGSATGIGGDVLHIMGEWTGPGAVTPSAIIMNNNTTASFGPLNPFSGYAESITISKSGSLTFVTSSNTYLNWKGIFGVYDGGTLNVGSSSNFPVSQSITAVLEMSASTNVDTGFEWQHGSNINIWGYKAFATSSQALQTSSHCSLMTSNIGGYCNTTNTTPSQVTASWPSQAQSFTGMTGLINIKGTNYTIGTVYSATSMSVTTNPGANTKTYFCCTSSAYQITCSNTTGWQAGDTLVFASTSQTAGDSETGSISSIPSPGNVILTTGLINPHLGTSPTQGEVLNITRNVKVRGLNNGTPASTPQGYINIQSTAVVNLNCAEFSYLGSATTNKHIIDIATTTGIFNMNYCSVHDCTNTATATSAGIYINSTTGNNISFNSLATYNLYYSHLLNAITTGIQTYNDLVGIGQINASSVQIYNFADAGSTYTNITAVSGISTGLLLSEYAGILGNSSNWNFHSMALYGCSIAIGGGIVNNIKCWRSPTSGIYTINSNNLIINNLTEFGCATSINFAAASGVQIYNSLFAGDIIFSTQRGIVFGGTSNANYVIQNITFENCTFGVNTTGSGGIYVPHTTLDIGSTNNYGPSNAILRNCILASPTPTSFQAELYTTPGISNNLMKIQCYNYNTASGDYRVFEPEGILMRDTQSYSGGTSPSLRITPTSGSVITIQSSVFAVPVSSGSTCNVSAHVRLSNSGSNSWESQSYNGIAPRLYANRNYAAGLYATASFADTFLNSGSMVSGSWQTITGTTAAVQNDCTLQFYVDCGSGSYTGGWMNIDQWSSTTVNNTKTLKYYQDAIPASWADNTSGGGATNVATAWWGD